MLDSPQAKSCLFHLMSSQAHLWEVELDLPQVESNYTSIRLS